MGECLLSLPKSIERDVQGRTDKGRELTSAIDAGKKLFERWLVLQNGVSIDSFLITWWPWKQVQLDGHLDWLHTDTSGSQNNCTCSCIVQRPDSFRSRGIKIKSIKVAIQLHQFPWSPRYEKLVYWGGVSQSEGTAIRDRLWDVFNKGWWTLTMQYVPEQHQLITTEAPGQGWPINPFQHLPVIYVYDGSAVDNCNGECSGRWRAKPAQGQDDPVEYSCPRLPRHTQKMDAPVQCTTFSPLRWSSGVGPEGKMLNLWRCNRELTWSDQDKFDVRITPRWRVCSTRGTRTESRVRTGQEDLYSDLSEALVTFAMTLQHWKLCPDISPTCWLSINHPELYRCTDLSRKMYSDCVAGYHPQTYPFWRCNWGQITIENYKPADGPKTETCGTRKEMYWAPEWTPSKAVQMLRPVR